jgi:hypothetical protein
VRPAVRFTEGFRAFATGVEVELAQNQRVVVLEQQNYTQREQSCGFQKSLIRKVVKPKRPGLVRPEHPWAPCAVEQKPGTAH